MKKDAIAYNYWIYIVTCLFSVVLMRFYRLTDLENQWELTRIFWILNLVFVCSTLAWFVGKIYNLHYFWICGFGWAGVIFVSFLRLVFTDFRSLGWDLFVFFTFVGIPFALFFIGGLVFLISYPFQFLYFKLRQKF